MADAHLLFPFITCLQLVPTSGGYIGRKRELRVALLWASWPCRSGRYPARGGVDVEGSVRCHHGWIARKTNDMKGYGCRGWTFEIPGEDDGLSCGFKRNVGAVGDFVLNRRWDGVSYWGITGLTDEQRSSRRKYILSPRLANPVPALTPLTASVSTGINDTGLVGKATQGRHVATPSSSTAAGAEDGGRPSVHGRRSSMSGAIDTAQGSRGATSHRFAPYPNLKAPPPAYEPSSGVHAVLNYVELLKKGAGGAQPALAPSVPNVASESNAGPSSRTAWRRVKSDSTAVIPTRGGTVGTYVKPSEGGKANAQRADLSVMSGQNVAGAQVDVVENAPAVSMPAVSKAHHGKAPAASSSLVPVPPATSSRAAPKTPERIRLRDVRVGESWPVMFTDKSPRSPGALVSPSGRAVIGWQRDASTERRLAVLMNDGRDLSDVPPDQIEELLRVASPSDLESSQTLPSEDK
ncbi:hypothetical protein PENSPDRAFT_667715 [Peniophora sp. CONT]|nr:hypothetical protein PENSPDRAFT_667715 [Peniophora sp. CONT]